MLKCNFAGVLHKRRDTAAWNRSVSARASGRCYRGPITWLKHLRGTIYRMVERTLLGYWIGKRSIVAIGDNKISNFLRLLREEKVGNGSD